jgi:hypothetical protein
MELYPGETLGKKNPTNKYYALLLIAEEENTKL